MDGVIVLAHGSKRHETEKTLESLISKVKVKTGLTDVVPAFLQFSGRSLEAAVKELASKGIKNIKVVPMFLFDGVHVTKDIPEELKEIESAYPDISIKMSRHLGDDERIADIIADRIKGEQV